MEGKRSYCLNVRLSLCSTGVLLYHTFFRSFIRMNVYKDAFESNRRAQTGSFNLIEVAL